MDQENDTLRARSEEAEKARAALAAECAALREIVADTHEYENVPHGTGDADDAFSHGWNSCRDDILGRLSSPSPRVLVYEKALALALDPRPLEVGNVLACPWCGGRLNATHERGCKYAAFRAALKEAPDGQ